ncbi:uncharacterized protein LOC143852458 [Tasmannia lanceolata]|uniref:uncharacterized protein LOC143852458 n=1 Tax=Tasmannia lanceolata TaxID=3420 RepID=UPI0040642C97
MLASDSPLREVLPAEFHSSPTGSHAGYFIPYKRISQNLFWKGLKGDVKRFVAGCVVCKINKYETLDPAGLLQPLPIPDRVWEDISMNFIDGLPVSAGKTVIMVVVDRLSKYAHFNALGHPYTARVVAEVFVRDVSKLHGMPCSIVSDRDPIFISNFLEGIFLATGNPIEDEFRLPSSNGWPNGDSQPELGDIFEVDKALCERDQLLRDLKDNLVMAQNCMKVQHDKHRTEREFQVDDMPEPVAVLNYRWNRQSGRFITEALVQWAGLPTDEATWLDCDDLRKRFPHFNLEDKVHLEGGGNDCNRGPARRSRRSSRYAFISCHV